MKRTILLVMMLLCGCRGDNRGDRDLGEDGFGATYHGDSPPDGLAGRWETYDSSDPFFEYYDPETGEWSGNGIYSALTIKDGGAYDEVVIIQTGAGTGCPSALWLHFEGPIWIDDDLITLERAHGISIGEDCRGHYQRDDGFTVPTYAWSVDERDVLALGDPAEPGGDAQLYARAE